MARGPKSEPVLWSAASAGLVSASVVLVRAFGVGVTDAQTNAILGFVAAVSIIGGFIARSQVIPTKHAVTRTRAEAAIRAAARQAPGDPTLPAV